MLNGGYITEKALHPTTPTPLPIYKPESYGLWYQDVNVNSVEFIKFKSGETACGER